MKLLSNIAVLIGLIVFVSSCQKEDLPAPVGSSYPGSTQRVSSPDNGGKHSEGSVYKDGSEDNTTPVEIVGNGDDDRDGGGSGGGQRIAPNTNNDHSGSTIQGEGAGDNVGDIVGNGDDDRDGGGDGSSGKKPKKGG